MSLGDVFSFAEDDCVALTSRDRTKAQAILARLMQRDIQMDQKFEHELRRMLMLNVKAELEALDRRNDIVNWLEETMTRCMTVG